MKDMLSWIDVYRNSRVRARMLEFFGGPPLERATAVFLVANTDCNLSGWEPRPVPDLDWCLQQGLGISRSLWDRRSLLVHLDVDYVHFDRPAEAYVNPGHAFALLAPVDRAVRSYLAGFGLEPLRVLSGRGYHYVWRLDQTSGATRKLRRLGAGKVPESLRRFYANPQGPLREAVDPRLAEAYLGLGLVMEFLAHSVKRLSQKQARVPVELTCLNVGMGPGGREMIALDISEYGDPLNMRAIRVPFSVYLKPGHLPGFSRPGPEPESLPWFCLPWTEAQGRPDFAKMREPSALAGLAESTSLQMPDQAPAMARLAKAYEDSELRDFHDWYYSQEPHPPSEWAQTYDRTERGILPPCAGFILSHPNDLLLNLSCIQRVVRVFLALGWHPRHVAGLLHSIYERDHDWGLQWRTKDPLWRAEFYARLFAGLCVLGTDELVDFNCRSAQEEQLCFQPHCPDNLAVFKKSLKERIHHERLASRPIHGLFLPETDS